MSNNKSLLLALVLSLVTVNSYAGAGQQYGGVQYLLGVYQEDGIEDVEPTALVGRFGKFMTDNFAVEGRLGIGMQDDSVRVFGTDVTLEIDTLMGVYGLAHADLNAGSSVYGLLGFTRAEATASATGASFSDTDTGLSFGVGAVLGSNEGVAFNIEFIQYLNKNDFDFSGLAFGAVFKF